jgi:hypothetical protein
VPADGFWFCRLTAFCATDGGSDGPIPATAGAAPLGPGLPDTGAATGGGSVVVWPLRLVTLIVLVTLLITTVLCTLLKMTLFGGGGATYRGGRTQTGTGR